MQLTTPPLAKTVIKTLHELNITTTQQLAHFGIAPTFLLLKEAGLTITRSTLWQLWAAANQRTLYQITDEIKKQLLETVKNHPPVSIFPSLSILEQFMAEALLEAKKAFDEKEIPIGCVIVSEGKIIGRGYNQSRSKNLIYAHAEIMAIKEASLLKNNFRLTECDLYTTIEPCPMCASAIIQARIKRVIIGAMEPKSGAAGSILNLFSDRKINQHTALYKGVMTEQCYQLLQSFFQDRRI